MKLTFKSLSLRILKASLTSITINIALYLLFESYNIIDTNLPISPDGRLFSMFPVLFASFIPILAAGIIFWVLQLIFHKYYVQIFKILASLILVLSLGTPFTIQAVPIKMVLGLSFMHIVVGISTLYFFTYKIFTHEK